MFRIVCLSIIVVFLFPSEVLAQVKINEFVPDSSPEWIEFYNSSASADYLKDYYLDDDTDFVSDAGSSSKKLLTTLNISNPTFPYIETSSFLNNSGDWVALFDEAGKLLDEYQFSSDPGRDVSFGRHPDGSGVFALLTYPTKGDANSPPLTPTPLPTPNSTPVSATSTPTSIPTPTKTPLATPTPTKKPSPTPRPTETPIMETVLGVEAASETPPFASDEGENVSTKFPIIPLLITGAGAVLIGLSLFLAIKKKKMLI